VQRELKYTDDPQRQGQTGMGPGYKFVVNGESQKKKETLNTLTSNKTINTATSVRQRAGHQVEVHTTRVTPRRTRTNRTAVFAWGARKGKKNTRHKGGARWPNRSSFDGSCGRGRATKLLEAPGSSWRKWHAFDAHF
jgi:hypothetical protein